MQTCMDQSHVWACVVNVKPHLKSSDHAFKCESKPIILELCSMLIALKFVPIILKLCQHNWSKPSDDPTLIMAQEASEEIS